MTNEERDEAVTAFGNAWTRIADWLFARIEAFGLRLLAWYVYLPAGAVDA